MINPNWTFADTPPKKDGEYLLFLQNKMVISGEFSEGKYIPYGTLCWNHTHVVAWANPIIEPT